MVNVKWNQDVGVASSEMGGCGIFHLVVDKSVPSFLALSKGENSGGGNRMISQVR